MGSDPRKVELPANRRGILTQPSLLALTSTNNETHPVKRGVFVHRQLFCGILSNPFQNLKIVLPAEDPNATISGGRARASGDSGGCNVSSLPSTNATYGMLGLAIALGFAAVRRRR